MQTRPQLQKVQSAADKIAETELVEGMCLLTRQLVPHMGNKVQIRKELCGVRSSPGSNELFDAQVLPGKGGVSASRGKLLQAHYKTPGAASAAAAATAASNAAGKISRGYRQLNCMVLSCIL